MWKQLRAVIFYSNHKNLYIRKRLSLELIPKNIKVNIFILIGTLNRDHPELLDLHLSYTNAQMPQGACLNAECYLSYPFLEVGST